MTPIAVKADAIVTGDGRLGDTLKLHASDEVDRAAIEVIKSHLDAHAQCNAGAGATPLPTLRVL